jgi:hypothetical protein
MVYEIAGRMGDGFERLPAPRTGLPGVSLRLGQSFRNKLIQALASSHRFERNLSVNLGRKPYHKFPAESPVCSSFWQRLSIDEQQFNPLFDYRLQLLDHVCLSLSVTALPNQRWGASYIALITVVPFDDLKVSSRGLFDLSDGWLHSWLSATALRTSFSW